MDRINGTQDYEERQRERDRDRRGKAEGSRD